MLQAKFYFYLTNFCCPRRSAHFGADILLCPASTQLNYLEQRERAAQDGTPEVPRLCGGEPIVILRPVSCNQFRKAHSQHTVSDIRVTMFFRPLPASPPFG